MKKLCLLLFLFNALFIKATTIEVCATCEVTTLKEALALAEDGDEIYLKKRCV